MPGRSLTSLRATRLPWPLLGPKCPLGVRLGSAAPQAEPWAELGMVLGALLKRVLGHTGGTVVLDWRSDFQDAGYRARGPLARV